MLSWLTDANGDYGRVQVRRVGGRHCLCGGVVRGQRSWTFPLAAWAPLASTCHATLLRDVLFVALAPDAAWQVLVLGFVVVAVLLGLVVLEPAVLLLRAVVVGPVLVV